nr:TolC family protein [Gammaproteobacteria bacterium]
TNSRNYQDSIGLQLSLPIFSGGLTYSQTEQARYQYQQALDQLESARRGTYRQARQSYNGILDSISGVVALRQAETSTRKALEATEAGFQVGTRTSVDVLNAQQRTFESRRDYKNAQYTYILGTLRLKQAAGTLSPDDLVPINSWLKQ